MLWHAWAFWARTFPANASFSFANGRHGHDQGREEMLQDKLKVRGGGREDEWQGEQHGARHGWALVLSLL
jgi:hypothetical protein